MDIESLEYFKEATKDMNITKTAQRLFLTQQTLSNHISRLEDWCGTPLFYRKPKLALTDAGFHMLEYAKKVLLEQENFQEQLKGIIDENHGTIRIGASFLRSNCCLPPVLPRFSERYPEVSFELVDGRSVQLLQMLKNNEIDIALTTCEEIASNIACKLASHDQVYLCVSEKLLNKYYFAEKETIKKRNLQGANLKDFENLPFVYVAVPNLLEPKIAKCFEEAKVVPKIYLSSNVTNLTAFICSQGLAACFLTGMALRTYQNRLGEDVNIFPLLYKKKPVHHDMYISYSKDRHMTKYKAYFLELLDTYLTGISHEDFSKCNQE